MIQKITYWFFSVVDAYMHYKYGSLKRQLFIGHPEELVEIGAGYGANFRYLEPGTKVIAIEPNAGLHRILRERAQNFEIDLVVYEAFAEEMPLPESSAEMVVSSLVLCSVKDPEKAISEIKRILKPEGKFIYLEHVKAHNQPIIGFVQRLIKVPWKCFFDGCNVTRDTGKIIQNSMFSKVKMEEFDSKTIFLPIIPHVCGVAVK